MPSGLDSAYRGQRHEIAELVADRDAAAARARRAEAVVAELRRARPSEGAAVEQMIRERSS